MVYYSYQYPDFLWEWPEEMKLVVWGGNTRLNVDSGFFYVLKAPVFTLSRNFILNAEV